MEGIVESEFVRPVLLGESILPYRVLPPREAVLPLENATMMDGSHPHLDFYPGLAAWWREAEQLWNANRTSENMSLLQRVDRGRGLTNQLPVPGLRVVYGGSGMHVVAALVDSASAVTEHKLYWGAVATREEGWYLCAILNCPELTQMVRPFMSYGKDERDIDKHVWKLSIPPYDPANPVHRRLSELGQQEAAMVAALDIDEKANFKVLRQQVRQELAAGSSAGEIEEIVVDMLA
jgi:hypothetical protein